MRTRLSAEYSGGEVNVDFVRFVLEMDDNYTTRFDRQCRETVERVNENRQMTAATVGWSVAATCHILLWLHVGGMSSGALVFQLILEFLLVGVVAHLVSVVLGKAALGHLPKRFDSERILDDLFSVSGGIGNEHASILLTTRQPLVEYLETYLIERDVTPGDLEVAGVLIDDGTVFTLDAMISTVQALR